MKEQTVANPTALYLTEADKAIATKVVDTITPITQVNTIFVLGKNSIQLKIYLHHPALPLRTPALFGCWY
ncbi:hypothetical protein LWM68_25400 [Niabella sp. W65]|nr:hypothetical protein [Niabella sp. W65]MCH7365805.1 hypothetical protein [Niabella sp. W65]